MKTNFLSFDKKACSQLAPTLFSKINQNAASLALLNTNCVYINEILRWARCRSAAAYKNDLRVLVDGYLNFDKVYWDWNMRSANYHSLPNNATWERNIEKNFICFYTCRQLFIAKLKQSITAFYHVILFTFYCYYPRLLVHLKWAQKSLTSSISSFANTPLVSI